MIFLGTAQFGLDYGLSNVRGQVPAGDIAAILRVAQSLGVSHLDTAPAYGQADAILGTLPVSRHFKLSMKLGAYDPSKSDISALRTEFDTSLRALGVDHADIVMLHRAQWFAGEVGQQLRHWLEAEQANGRINHIGVSVYTPAELESVLASGPVDWVQLPLSILDPHWWYNGHLQKLAELGIKTQARSVLLQGLILAEAAQLPAVLEGARPALSKLEAASEALGISRLELALAFARAAPVDAIVLGVTTTEELRSCLNAYSLRLNTDWFAFDCKNVAVTDPRKWPQGLKIG